MTATGKALLVVDVQRDFCPGGSLAVKDGDAVVLGLNKVIAAALAAEVPIFFTRDWHPSDHISFRAQGGPWPPHCVQDTLGAEFHNDLRVPKEATIISKGDDPKREAYSGFQGTDLATLLKNKGVTEVVIGGLTTDYCVKGSSLDALRAGFKVDVMVDCIKPVDVRPGDGARALDAVKKAGASLTHSEDVIRSLAGARQ